MNFTGSLIRPTYSLALGAVVVAWSLSLLSAPRAVVPEQTGPAMRVTAIAEPATLNAQQAALRQLGEKLATTEGQSPDRQLAASP